MRQLQLVAHGEPADVIELNTVSEPALGREDVEKQSQIAPTMSKFIEVLQEAIKPAEVAGKWRVDRPGRCRCESP